MQELYGDLQRLTAEHRLSGQHHLQGHQHRRPRRRPSGLTIIDHIGGGSVDEDEGPSSSGRNNGGGLSWLANLGRAWGGNGGASHNGSAESDVQNAVRGLYMYGGVGCGKTMLMDVFVSTAPAHFKVSSGGTDSLRKGYWVISPHRVVLQQKQM